MGIPYQLGDRRGGTTRVWLQIRSAMPVRRCGRGMKSEDAKVRLIDAGMRHLRTSDPRISFPILAMPPIIEASGVSRATAYRVFGGSDRDVSQAFADAVLCSMAQEFARTVWTYRPTWFNSMVARAQESGVSQDTNALEEVGNYIFDAGVDDAMAFIGNDLGSLLVVGGCATLSIENPSKELVEALTLVRLALGGQLGVLLREALAALGLRVEDPWDFESLSTVLIDLTTMHVIRSQHAHQRDDAKISTGNGPDALKIVVAAVMQSALGTDKRMVLSPDVGRMLGQSVA